MRHSWRGWTEWIGTTGSAMTRLDVWKCDRCGTVLSVSEHLNEGMDEFRDRSGVGEDCDFEVVRNVLTS